MMNNEQELLKTLACHLRQQNISFLFVIQQEEGFYALHHFSEEAAVNLLLAGYDVDIHEDE